MGSNFSPDYDKGSVSSILSFAENLTGKTLREGLTELKLHVPDFEANKGSVGTIMESHFFRHRPPNDHEPDFKDAGLELKTTGVIRDNKVPGGFRAKERLVLSMINFHDVVGETFTSSKLMHKCQLMLLMFYLYQNEAGPLDVKFPISPKLLDGLAQIDEDKEQISDDWHQIQSMIHAGRAHEISEGMTKFLGACTKSANSGVRTSQPYSEIPAKPRAFSLKQGYMTALIAGSNSSFVSLKSLAERQSFQKAQATTVEQSEQNTDQGGQSPAAIVEKATNHSQRQPFDFEEYVENKIGGFLGASEEDLAKRFGIQMQGRRPKNFARTLVNAILVGNQGEPLELTKAGIEMKTIHLRKSGKPKESMSFPNWDPMKIIHENPSDSNFLNILEQRFLFVVFRETENGSSVLQSAKFWSMPEPDRKEAEEVWERTVRAVEQNKYEDLPKLSDGLVAHVRPKAQNSSDTHTTPHGTEEVKRCFWLNAKYIEKVLLSLGA